MTLSTLRNTVLRRLLCLAPLLLLAAFFVPQTALACVATPGGGPVWYAGCTEAQDTDGGAGSIPVPAGTAIGDTLILTIVREGNAGVFTTPTNFTVIDGGNNSAASGANDVEYYVYGWVVNSAPPANITLNVSGGSDYLATLMRFTGSQGWDAGEVAFLANSATTTAPAPGITTALNNSLVLRMGGFDDDDYATQDADPVMTGHTTISQFETADASTSAVHAYLHQLAAGAVPGDDFDTIPTANEESRTVSMALRPWMLCTGTNAIASGGEVEYAGCEQKSAVDATSVIVTTPAGTTIGNYLLAVVVTDGNTTGSIAAPAGWDTINVGAGAGNANTLAIYGRAADADGAQDHTFTWTGTQDAFAYIMRFTGTDGVNLADVASATATGTNVSTPSFNTAIADTLVVRIGAFDNNAVNLNPATVITGHNNVTQGRSSGDTADSVSSAAAWINQASIGATGTASFVSAPTASEETRTVTLGLRPRPPHFRIVHAGSGTTCAPTTITITRYNGLGNVNPAYTGTVQLSTNSLNGSWAIGSGTGTLTPGPGDGTATYTFGAGDLGTVDLQFFHNSAGTVNFNVVDGSFVESAGYDPDLNVTACNGNPLLFQQVCSNASNTVNTVNLPADDGNRLVLVTVHRAGGVSGGGGNLADGSMVFDGIAMTKMQEAQINSTGNDVQVLMWGLLDSALPAGAGPFTVTAQPLATTRICVFVYQNMDQSALPTGPPTADTTIEGADGLDIETSVDTQLDDALVLSAVSARIPSGTRNWSDPPDADLQTRNWSGNSGNLSFGVSSGIIANNGPVTVTETHDGADSNRRAHVLATLRPLTRTLDHFRISHAGSGGICGANDVTFSAIDQYGDVLTTYTGTITLAAEGVGDWSELTANGTLLNGTADDGAATYQFNALDAGVVTLQYSDDIADASKNFNVNAGAIVESPFFDPSMNLANCVFRITHAAANGSTCAPNSVTIGAYNLAGGLMTAYTGAITLSTALVPGPGSGLGDWGVGDGQGAFNNGTANDGLASYTFVAGDNGEVTLTFSKTAASTVNFNITATGMSVDAGYDANLVLTNCFFRISHDGSGDVCTPEAITITVVSSTGVTQANYTGTVNLSTATSVGDWSETSALGTLNNTGSGAASYTFHDDDNGVVVLNLMHHSTSASVNINLNSGSFQEQAGFDPALAVVGCKIRFSLSSANATSCTNTTVTLGVYNSGGALATNYAGAVSLTTSTSHGTWLSADGAGLVDSNPGNGTGTYTFAGSEGGDVALVFTSDDVELINFNASANSGAIIVDTGSPTYDPDLNISACLPSVSDVACYPNQSQANAITLPASATTQASRMVLMYINSESTTPATGATLEGVAMTLLRTEIANFGLGNLVQVYGILDADLPTDAGDYDAAFTGSVAPAMCLVAVEGVAQTFPQPDTPPEDGQINGSNVNGTDPITTTITTAENNSLVISVTGNGTDGTTYISTLPTQLWQAGVADAPSADWAGHYGYQLAAGAVTVTDNASATPNRQAQVVLALAPIVTGAPAVTGYVPVTLYETFAGNVNYRAIGNTLRLFPNGGSACVMVSPDTVGSTATLDLPAGSTITSAYLYWAGSGFEVNADADVVFGVDGSPRTPITADEVFLTVTADVFDPAPPYNIGFFAAYKDVTGLVTTGTNTTYRFSDLSVQTGADWLASSSCVAGWSLVVVYDNPGEPLNVINLFHGFQPFWHTAFTLVPRNFRMATPDGDLTPHAQVTHVTFEGDTDIFDADEVIGLQNDPDMLSFTSLTGTANPANNQYNDTVTYPNYDDITLDFNETYTEFTNSYGTDVDTYYVKGADPGDHIYEFGFGQAEQITTRYATGQDLVLLVGEFISVNNAPIADLEITVTDGGTWKVGTNGAATYTYTVTNNGNGATSGGFANGDVIVTGNMPTGISFDPLTDISATGWDCTLATTTAFTCVFEISEANVGDVTDGELNMGESLPPIVVTLDVADDSVFTLLDNDVTTVGRLAHVGDYYEETVAAPNVCQSQGAAAGVQPDPNPLSGCYKAAQFDNVNDLNKYLVDIDDLDEKSGTNNNVHDNMRNVRGIETNLSMSKGVVGILEANKPAVYQLTVQNLGPDATTKTITVTDTLPGGLEPLTAGGANWSCNIAGQLVTCTRTNAFPLANGGTAPVITIETGNIESPAVEGVFVSNTATVSIGNGNFDTVSGNNSDTDLTEVTGPLADGTEKFLISVNETSTIGGVTFEDGDLVVYDPVADTAQMFLDESSIPGTTNLGDVNAVHVLPNGHIILSSALDGATINNLTFNAEDLVLFDPLLGTVTLIFDGSTVFSSDTVDIDAVHVNYNGSYDPEDWTLVISTAATATITAVGSMPADLAFENNDLVLYNMDTNEATPLVDGADVNVFGPTQVSDIGGVYIRYTDSDRYALAVSDPGDNEVTVGPSGAQTTINGADLAELDLNTNAVPPPSVIGASPLFCDSDTPCDSLYPADFTTVSNTRRIDGIHMVEDGYFGHFAVTSTGGDTCSATTITLRKHAGLTHVAESGYRGSIRISNSLNQGTWAKDVTANGTLITSGYGLGPGEAIYTFAAADAGEVMLFITGTDASNTFNVDIRTNVAAAATVTRENAPSEDPNIVISDLVTPITYADQFSSVAFTNDDGIATFAGAWSETNDDNSAAAGDIRIVSNQLRFNNLGGGLAPALTRTIDFSGYTVDATPKLRFDYTISGSPAGTFVAEVRDDDMDPTWTTLWSTSAVTGSGTSGDLLFAGVTLTSTTQIRFRISSGYSANASEFMFIDNVQVSTETNDCGVGDEVDHYAITHSGTMVSCQMELVTITPHTVGELTVEPQPGTMITLNTSTGKGRWGPPTNGSGNFNAALSNGSATYTYVFGDDALTFPFYYTDLASDPELVTITVSDSSVPTNSQLENQVLEVARAGLRFFNETDGNENFPTLVAGMPSNVYPGDVLTVQAVQTSDNDPAMCVSTFDDGDIVDIELAFECIDPANCAAGPEVNVVNSNDTDDIAPIGSNSGGGTAGDAGYATMTLAFEEFSNGDVGDGTYIGAQLVLTYPDAGQLQIHGRYEIVVEDEDGNPLPSTDYMRGSGGNNFVVRPFALDIDFNIDPDGVGGDPAFFDRLDNGNGSGALTSATAASDADTLVAGVGIDTRVRAVAWQSVDDDAVSGGQVANDGIPDVDADLYDNAVTPNFGNEIDGTDDDVTLTPSLLVAPVGGTLGTLGTPTFTTFAGGGQQMHSVSYSEVGIVDIAAELDSGNYLAGGEPVTGFVRNVGRFIPADFLLSVPLLTARPEFMGSDPWPMGTTPFTYLGEEFQSTFTLTARNAGGGTTKNYFGDYAKLRFGTSDVDFYAVDDVALAADVNYTNFGAATTLCNGVDNNNLRICESAANGFDFTVDWPLNTGVQTFTGRLIFSRQATEVEEDPFEDLQIGVSISDDDGVADALNDPLLRIQLDDDITDAVDTEYNRIATHRFLYGRIRLENGYGTEIADLYNHDEDTLPDPDGTLTADVPRGRDVMVRLVAEYYDGAQFLPNPDDIATPYDSAEATLIDPDAGDNLATTDPVITAITGEVYRGATYETQSQSDIPLFLQAPGEDKDGQLLLQLNLDALGISYLKYDWRDANVDPFVAEENTDGTTDHPRALIEFGTFRGNDRIINWQEIFE